MLDEYLCVGEIVRPQGLRGELKIKPLTDDPERFLHLSRVRVNGEALRFRCSRVNDGFVYGFLSGIFSREAAEPLHGALLYVHRDEAVSLPEGADFICDLIGCEAVDTEGVAHGTLTDVLQPGGADVYVFKGPLGELMVPALKRVMLSVDVQSKHILLDAKALSETAVYSE